MTKNEESYFYMKDLRKKWKDWKLPKRGREAWDDALRCMKKEVDKEYKIKFKILSGSEDE